MKNKERRLVASEVAKQEEHPEKSKCLFMFYEQNA
jgi:hypothetical protein